MKKLLALLALAPFFIVAAADQVDRTDEPRYNPAGELVRPSSYRQWVWLSSGLGMAYGPAADGTTPQNPPFDNVFVSPSAYRGFLQTGKWPDKTVFVLEIRTSQAKASIDQRGYSQGGLLRIEAHVKDEKRFPRKWGFFSFGEDGMRSAGIPFAETSNCFTCHEKSGALDTTFAQFYPEVRTVAKAKGTME